MTGAGSGSPVRLLSTGCKSARERATGIRKFRTVCNRTRHFYSSVHIFSDSFLVTNVRASKRTLLVGGNREGHITVNQVGDSAWGTVWFSVDATMNILSFAKLRIDGASISYSHSSDGFVVDFNSKSLTSHNPKRWQSIRSPVLSC